MDLFLAVLGDTGIKMGKKFSSPSLYKMTQVWRHRSSIHQNRFNEYQFRIFITFEAYFDLQHTTCNDS